MYKGVNRLKIKSYAAGILNGPCHIYIYIYIWEHPLQGTDLSANSHTFIRL